VADAQGHLAQSFYLVRSNNRGPVILGEREKKNRKKKKKSGMMDGAEAT